MSMEYASGGHTETCDVTLDFPVDEAYIRVTSFGAGSDGDFLAVMVDVSAVPEDKICGVEAL